MKKRRKSVMLNFKKSLSRLNPVVPKPWLLVIAGIMWTGVGVMLCRYAFTWLYHLPWYGAVIPLVLGIGFSWAIYHFGFSKVALKNIKRIILYADKACLFAFQTWKGYLIIVVMMTGGILLRNSSLPRAYLAVLYTAIGGGLFLSSFHYYAHFQQMMSAKLAVVPEEISLD
jgi:hypothetical protein